MLRKLTPTFKLLFAVAGMLVVACAQPLAATPTPGRTLEPVATPRVADNAPELNYLRTEGNKIVDAAGQEVIITGVSWFGMETNTLAPHGIWARPYQEVLDDVVRMGFNTIRLPFSNEVFDERLEPLGVDPKVNPDLVGLSSLEIMDRIIVAAGERGLKVILDRHRPSSDGQSKLWYSDEISEDQWIADWLTLVRRYRHNDTVIGVDLHNEPAGDSTWGTDDPKTDWRRAAERAGNAILEENPNLLIFVEGIERLEDDFGNVLDWYWMGGALQLARSQPIRLNVPNRLVYSPHDYGPGVYPQGWFDDPEFPENLPRIWDHHWGYLHKEQIAPIVLGEFGGKSVGDDAEGIWQRTLVQYLKENGMGYLYWSLNGNSGDTGGLLQDDWQTVDEAKIEVLASHQGSLIGNRNPTYVDTTAVPGPRPPTIRDVKLLHKDTSTDKWTMELKPEIHVANKTTSPLSLQGYTARYWFTADGATVPGAEDQVVEVTGVSVGYPEQQLGADKATARLVRDPGSDRASDAVYYVEISFADGVAVPPRDTLAVKLSIRKKDGNPYFQENDFSYRSYHWQAEWDRVALYQDGERVWGLDPQTHEAQVRQELEAKRARVEAELGQRR